MTTKPKRRKHDARSRLTEADIAQIGILCARQIKLAAEDAARAAVDSKMNAILRRLAGPARRPGGGCG